VVEPDRSKPGRAITFTVPRSKGKGDIVVTGAFQYEGAELELAASFGKMAADMWNADKLWFDDDGTPHVGPRPPTEAPPPATNLDAALKAFEASRNTARLEHLMRSIGSVIGETAEYVASISDDQAIESLLGSAYLLCQAHMRAVLLRLASIEEIVRGRKAARSKLARADEDRLALLDLPCPRMVGAYSLPRVIWALAEFHRLRDQLPATRASARGAARGLLAIVSAAGVDPQTPAPLQTAAKALGVTQYAHLDLLSTICEHWGNVLAADVHVAIGRQR
jgi:hypothetical protein